MKYTPGPWKVDDNTSIVAQFEGQKVQIAAMMHTRWSYPDGGKTKRLSEQSKANAILMATAPTLLEALERILDDYEGMNGACGSIVRQASAAIAAAQGAVGRVPAFVVQMADGEFAEPENVTVRTMLRQAK